MDATGYYGEYTAQAVANFQNQNSLDSTGIVDEKTYNALFSDNAVANPKTEVVSGEVSPAVSAAPIECLLQQVRRSSFFQTKESELLGHSVKRCSSVRKIC